MGGSAGITWNIIKKKPGDRINSIRLFVGRTFTDANLLYEGIAGSIRLDSAKMKFGDRIQTIFKDSNYTARLSNLDFNDTINFTL